MAIITRHRFDGNLPPAALYLDDIESIVGIIQAKTPDLYHRKDGKPCNIKFHIGLVECDSTEELRQLGDHTNSLRIESDWCNLDLYHGQAKWHSYAGTDVDREVHGLLMPIFKSRQHRFTLFRNRSIPNLMIAAFMPVLLMLCGSIVFFDLRFSFHKLAGGVLYLLGAFGMYSLGTTISDALPSYSTIYFRKSHEPIPSSSRWIPAGRELVRLVILTAVTAIVSGIIGVLIGQHSK